MSDRCLICGEAHKNPIRGGKVAFLRHCYRRERGTKGFQGKSLRRIVRDRKAGNGRLQDAVNGWGVSGGNGFGEMEIVP